jgi:hypothetical protein
MVRWTRKTKATRRTFLATAAGLGALAATTSLAIPRRVGAKPVPLPTADQIRRDYQRMVDFGPRLCGHPNHVRFVEWLGSEFAKTGLHLGPCDEYAYRRWDPLKFGLEVQDSGTFRPMPKVAYYVRSQPTSPDGVTGPLVYGGRITPTGPAELGDIPAGSIVVFDGEIPKLAVGSLLKDIHYAHLKNQTQEAFLSEPYKRLWTTPAYPLEVLATKGAAGAVIIMDVSSDRIAGNFSPHASSYKPPLPALFVGQDVGAALKTAAKSGATSRLTLSAEWVDCSVPSLTAILPGQSDEVIVLNTHTDGQNFIEENGNIALLHLARHFSTLPPGQRLRRTLVFACWPGHMTGLLPECAGWIRSHPDLKNRAAAAVTIEHLGATEWDDIPGSGYGPTGRNEFVLLSATGGAIARSMQALIGRYDLDRHVIKTGPGITVGSAFHQSGVPHAACITGPNYLLGIADNGHMDKLDAQLAARQTAMLAELVKQIDRIPADRLRAGDSSLGAKPVTGPDTSQSFDCSARQSVS